MVPKSIHREGSLFTPVLPLHTPYLPLHPQPSFPGNQSHQPLPYPSSLVFCTSDQIPYSPLFLNKRELSQHSISLCRALVHSLYSCFVLYCVAIPQLIQLTSFVWACCFQYFVVTNSAARNILVYKYFKIVGGISAG